MVCHMSHTKLWTILKKHLVPGRFSHSGHGVVPVIYWHVTHMRVCARQWHCDGDRDLHRGCSDTKITTLRKLFKKPSCAIVVSCHIFLQKTEKNEKKNQSSVLFCGDRDLHRGCSDTKKRPFANCSKNDPRVQLWSHVTFFYRRLKKMRKKNQSSVLFCGKLFFLKKKKNEKKWAKKTDNPPFWSPKLYFFSSVSVIHSASVRSLTFKTEYLFLSWVLLFTVSVTTVPHLPTHCRLRHMPLSAVCVTNTIFVWFLWLLRGSCRDVVDSTAGADVNILHDLSEVIRKYFNW